MFSVGQVSPNVFGVGKYCYVASARWCTRRLGANGGGDGGAYCVAMCTACSTVECFATDIALCVTVYVCVSHLTSASLVAVMRWTLTQCSVDRCHQFTCSVNL